MGTDAQADLAALLGELIAIPSVNPAFGGQGEAAIADMVAARLERSGMETIRQEVFPGRSNLIARAGDPAQPGLLLEAHLDTVAADGWTTGDPFRPEFRDGKIFGRGACDTKGSLAVFLSVFEYFARRPEELAIPLIFAATVDEEEKQSGAFRLMEAGLPLAAAITGEPTLLNIIHAHKGVLRFRITSRGVAAHSAFPERGKNAINRMAPVLSELENLASELASREPDPNLGRPTLNIGTIRGGQAVNVVPDHCVIEVDRRLLPNESGAAVLADIQTRLGELPGMTVEPAWLDRPGMETPPQHPFSRQLAAAVERAAGACDFLAAPYMTNATAYAAAGIPALVFGPGDIAQAHTDGEFIETGQLDLCYRLLLDLCKTCRL